MKDNNISLLNYSFNYFFQYCIQKYQIQVISHHFSNHKIEGLTVVDKLGTSFSYEIDSPKVKQNFTLCHELGHFILKHDGNYFAESIDNKENLLEREANIFSAVVLIPDIVLLSKIYYNRDTFHQVQNIAFADMRSFYTSVECVERGLYLLRTSLCVMSRADNSNGLILASSPMFKKVF